MGKPIFEFWNKHFFLEALIIKLFCILIEAPSWEAVKNGQNKQFFNHREQWIFLQLSFCLIEASSGEACSRVVVLTIKTEGIEFLLIEKLFVFTASNNRPSSVISVRFQCMNLMGHCKSFHWFFLRQFFTEATFYLNFIEIPIQIWLKQWHFYIYMWWATSKTFGDVIFCRRHLLRSDQEIFEHRFWDEKNFDGDKTLNGGSFIHFCFQIFFKDTR